MPLFEKRDSFSRPELRKSLGRDSGIIPKTGGQRFSYDQREKMGREVFGSKYGSQISSHDYKSAVRDLKNTKVKVEDPKQRAEIDKKINYLKRLGGIQ